MDRSSGCPNPNAHGDQYQSGLACALLCASARVLVGCFEADVGIAKNLLMTDT